MFRDQKVVRAPRKTRINNRYSWLYFLIIFPDFQFWDLRKINKEAFFLGPARRSLIKNKTQTAVTNIVNYRIFKFIKNAKAHNVYHCYLRFIFDRGNKSIK